MLRLRHAPSGQVPAIQAQFCGDLSAIAVKTSIGRTCRTQDPNDRDTPASSLARLCSSPALPQPPGAGF